MNNSSIQSRIQGNIAVEKYLDGSLGFQFMLIKLKEEFIAIHYMHVFFEVHFTNFHFLLCGLIYTLIT